ncbi:hypothetical protein HK101_000888 [Irineochytrium annulatum]|nr:hypothetical protein HK101_000888 [Irineochytrium annulatum]
MAVTYSQIVDELISDEDSVVFDAAQSAVIVINQNRKVDIVPARAAKDRVSIPLSVSAKGYIRNVKLSSQNAYMGVLRSAKTLEIHRLNGDEAQLVTEVTKDAKPSDAILGFEWTYDSEMIIITGDAIDFYQFSENRKIFVLRKTVHLSVNWYIYSHLHHVVIVSNVAQSLFLFHIKRTYTATPLPNVKLDPKRLQGDPRAPILKKNISLFSLYDRLYCSYVDTTASSAILHLYRVTKVAVKLEYVLNLEEPGSFIVSSVDNLLVAHNLSTKKFSIFDVKASTTPEEKRAQVVRAEPLLKQVMESTTEQHLYIDGWLPFVPNFILSLSSGELFEVAINLSEVVAEMTKAASRFSPPEIIELLLRRKDDRVGRLLIELLKALMVRRTELSILRQSFDLINNAIGASLLTRGRDLKPTIKTPVPPELKEPPPADAMLGLEDIYNLLFKPISEEEVVPADYLASCLLEYIGSTARLSLPTLHLCSELLASVLIRTRSAATLHQLIRAGVIPDSVGVSRILILAGSARPKPPWPGGLQCGIDMLARIGMDEDVVEALVGTGKVLEALRYAISTNTLRSFPVSFFLEPAHTSGNDTLFLNVYKALEDAGILPPEGEEQDDTSSLSASGISLGDSVGIGVGGIIGTVGGIGSFGDPTGPGRYLSIYRELWGEVVEMEGL